jgi:hypothetical protein
MKGTTRNGGESSAGLLASLDVAALHRVGDGEWNGTKANEEQRKKLRGLPANGEATAQGRCRVQFFFFSGSALRWPKQVCLVGRVAKQGACLVLPSYGIWKDCIKPITNRRTRFSHSKHPLSADWDLV